MIRSIFTLIILGILFQSCRQNTKTLCIEQIEMISPEIIEKELYNEEYPILRKDKKFSLVLVKYLDSKSNYKIAKGKLILSFRGDLEFKNSFVSFYFCEKFFVKVPLQLNGVLSNAGFFEFKGLNDLDNFEIKLDNGKKIKLIYNDLNNIYEFQCNSDTLFINSVEQLIAPY